MIRESSLSRRAATLGQGLSDAEFEFVRKVVLERSGIALDTSRKYLAESRLAPLARKNGVPTVGELVRNVRKEPYRALTTALVEAMTTNETSFFRDIHPFEALRTTVLPEIREKNGKRLHIWCAACSTGQEPYSIAMLLSEHFPDLVVGGSKIFATDLSTEVLERAKSGKYTQLEVNRGLAATSLVRHFRRRGREWMISKKIQELVKFQPTNLLRPVNLGQKVEIVFLRNVLIYFKEDVKKQVLTNVKRTMKSGAYLFMGGAETILGIDDEFETVRIGRTMCYRLKR